MKHPERLSDYLENIVEAIGRAAYYVEGMDFTAFEQDTRTQDAVVRNIEIIGEAATKLYSVSLESRVFDFAKNKRARYAHAFFANPFFGFRRNQSIYQVAPDYVNVHQDIPWSHMRGMRNIIAHEYWGIDIEIVWRTALNDLPGLLQQLRELLRKQK